MLSLSQPHLQVLMLNGVLALSELLPSISPLLLRVVESTLPVSGPHAEYEESYANSAWVLGTCLQCLAHRDRSEWAPNLDITACAAKVAEVWGWSSGALAGIVPLIHASQSAAPTIALDAVYPSLQASLLSHSRPLRLYTLRLLTSQLVESPPGTLEVLRRCLHAEEVPLDVQGARERVLKIGRLPGSVKDGNEVAADICARWLIAQLKVNLRPLWSSASEALSALSGRFGDLVWRLVFEEVQVASAASPARVRPEWMTEESEAESDPISEDERTWRDPSAHKMRLCCGEWGRHDGAKRAVIQAQTVDDRFDLASYEAQLLSALGDSASLAEKHSRDLVPHFLAIADPEAPSRLPRHKWSAWLTLFSKFVNPKALRSTESLRSIYVSLLSHPDRSLQRLALSCLLTYKSPHLSPHENTLRGLLDDTRWRDDLTQLDIATITEDDRQELVDVIVRLLFGLMLEKRGRSRGADRRAAVLSALGGCTDDELHLLVDLMLQPLRKNGASHEGDHFAIRAVPDGVSDKQQVGFLTLLGDVLKNLGSRITSRWPVIMETLLDLLAHAQGRLDVHTKDNVHTDAVAEAEEEGDDVEQDEGSSRVIRSIRQLGLKRIADFFRCPVAFDFTPYMQAIFQTSISPRLPLLDLENTQAPSSLLELFYVWASREEYARFLVLYDDRLLPQVYACLVATGVKPTVLFKVFDIVDRLLALSAEVGEIREVVLKPHVSVLLTNMSLLIERTKGVNSVSDTLGRRQISILSAIAPYSTDAAQAAMLLNLFFPLLRKPAKAVPEKVKVDLANIMCSLFPLIPELSDPASPMHMKTFALLSQLFQTLRSRQARLSLLSAFRQFAVAAPSVSALADLMDSLNAYSTKRMDEPDFDRRLAAFTQLNETLYSSLTCKEWLPIIYNMLNFIQDPDELTVRNNASFALKRFADGVATTADPEFETTFVKVLYVGLKNGLRSKNEMVRAEVLGVISHAVAKCSSIGSLQEMRVLLAGGDEEANFFNNIHHVQIHRRTRAIRRLAEYSEEGHLRSTTLADIFVPLVGNYVVSTDTLDHHLVTEAISATGRMAQQLSWGAYHALIQRYLKLVRMKDTSERVYIRAIVAILDHFHFPMDQAVSQSEENQTVERDDNDEEDADEDVVTDGPAAVLVKPSDTSRIEDAVNTRLLPSLLRHLEKRDETEDSLRIPISVGIVQVAKHLPQSTREPQISKLLTVLCQAFRSRSQETRDLTRETLCRIAIILGPSYLPLILRELRAALLRGPHLHVLAYVVHALLVHVTTGEHASLFPSLDECVNDVAHVSAEVIFGESGKDVQSENFKTKMREVRSSSGKGLDSFAILAKFITPPKISNLLVPIRNILKETESLKAMQQADDLLRRIAGGLNANSHLAPPELLVLCHTLISQNARFLKYAAATPKPRGKRGNVRRDHIVQMKRHLDEEVDHYANNSHRFVSFGLDLFNTAHRRSRFDFQDTNVIARLEPMVAVIGNTLYSDHMQVIVPGLKAAAAISKCPLKSIDKSIPVFIRQMLDVIKRTGTTEPEGVQTALKSLATILRERPSAQVKEKDLVYLLELLSPDLEDPTRQGSVFTMLRAIVARKFVVPEIYDMMDKVSEVMVMSQSPQVQELCRGVLLQFLLDYPQGKGRLRNQITLMAKNLSYVYESGRKSVMELLGAIISKFEIGLVREYSDLLFVALVMVIANDDSAKCREMAAELIKSLFARLADVQRNVILSHVHAWAVQYSQPQLARVSLQILGIIIDLLQQDITPYVSSILEDVNGALKHSTQLLESAMTESEDGELAEQHLDWQLPYHALMVSTKILRVCPELTPQSDILEWTAVIAHLVFPHAWVRTASCRLLGVLFSATAIAAPRADLPNDSPFSVAGMEDVANKFCLQLRSSNLDDALSLQVVKNLFYVGKCFCAIEMPSGQSSDDASENGEDDDEGDESGEDEDAHRHPLPWLFSKLSYQVRTAHIARRNKSHGPDNWSQQPASVLKWFAAMVSYMAEVQVERFLVHILSPVYRITEEDTIRDSHMDELKTLAVELQDLVQAKVGTTKFGNIYNRIRQGVLGVRRERRTARVMQATTNPEGAAKRKMQRNVMKKDSRKRKNKTFTDGKGRPKRRRAE
ncbi:armadillo-type protein [Amylocystis lapponica]|nr:armadillo-type protein [Amylocystis lapponica]